MTTQISETIVTGALEKLSWTMMSAHLADVALTPPDVEKLLGLVRRSDPLLLRRPNPVLEKKRDKLLQGLADHLEKSGYPDEAALVRGHDARVREIDEVYIGILDTLGKTAAAAFAPELRVSALLERSNIEFVDVQKRFLKEIIGNEVLDFSKTLVTGDDGQVFSPESVHELLVATFASTLGMEAHINGWYDSQGVLVLPSLPLSTHEQQYAVGSVQFLAAGWRGWQLAERRHRYLGGFLEKRTDLPPDWIEKGFTSLWQSVPAQDDREINHHLANIRLEERLKQHWNSMLGDPRYRNLGKGIGGSVELPPKEFISLEEVHAVIAISQLLSLAISEDATLYAGLTLIEWVRGYSALQELCREACDSQDATRFTMRFTRDHLAARLATLGLLDVKAQLFIKHATYTKASRDLFDQPLITMGDGSLVLLALSGGMASIPKVVLSTLGMLDINLDGRGKRFEKYIIGFLGKQGIDARNILCNRDGETYDYDVVFVWGDYLFHLECKSRGIPGSDPSRTYYFSLGVRDVVKQVKRLAEGLRLHPDILAEHFPQAVDKKVVHCVLNALPFAIVGDVEGIYFTDEGSLTRFFQESGVGLRRVDPQKGMAELDPASVIAYLWDGDGPAPEDLLRQLRHPMQLVMALSKTKIASTAIPLSTNTLLGLNEFGRDEATPDIYRAAAREAGYRTGDDQPGQAK